MKTLMVSSFAMLMVLNVAAFAQHAHSHDKHESKPVALTGEVVDLTCFMVHPKNATGMEHAKCAKSCVNKGLPIGFLAADGTVFLLVGTEHEPIVGVVADLLGKKTTLNGTIFDHHGMKAFALASVGAAESAVYTCSMHPSVHSDKPGKCPECGMDLQRAHR